MFFFSLSGISFFMELPVILFKKSVFFVGVLMLNSRCSFPVYICYLETITHTRLSQQTFAAKETKRPLPHLHTADKGLLKRLHICGFSFIYVFIFFHIYF